MNQDRNGWNAAPAGLNWCCPDCERISSVDDWSRCTIIDDHDAIEDARLCPNCGTIISAQGSSAIARVTEAYAENPALRAGAAA